MKYIITDDQGNEIELKCLNRNLIRNKGVKECFDLDYIDDLYREYKRTLSENARQTLIWLNSFCGLYFAREKGFFEVTTGQTVPENTLHEIYQFSYGVKTDLSMLASDSYNDLHKFDQKNTISDLFDNYKRQKKIKRRIKNKIN